MEDVKIPFKTDRFTLCMPRFCIYQEHCPVKGPRQRLVETAACFRYAPAHKRPPSTLSPAARQLLEQLHRGALGTQST